MARVVDGDGRRFLVVLNLLVLLAVAIESVVRVVSPAPVTGAFVLGLVTNVPIHLGILLVARRYRRSTIFSEYAPQVARWTVVGGLLLGVLIGVWGPLMYDTWFDQVATIRWAVSIGLGGGFGAGFVTAHVTTQRLAAERASIRADEARQRQDLLEYLNATLRHEVLNATSIILGLAEILEDRTDTDPDPADPVQKIKLQAGGMTSIVQDIQVLLRANEESVDWTRYDITDRIEAVIPRLTERDESVEIELDLPEEAVVRANDLLPRAFENLFRNAIEHNDATPAHLGITGSVRDGILSVEVEDDGTGIPADLRENLFEPTISRRDDTTRLGTVIVGRLIEQHGGQVEVVETGRDGTMIVVTLPLADAEAPGGVDDSDADPRRVAP